MPLIEMKLVIRYVKFDTFTPAVERGLPVTRVISRMVLQGILARAVGEDIIMNGSNVVNFVDDGNKVIGESFMLKILLIFILIMIMMCIFVYICRPM